MRNPLQYNFPAPLIFFLLLAFTCVTPFVVEPGLKLTGLLLIMWGVFSLMRCLWILETAFLLEDADQGQRSVLLPWLILSGMDLRPRLDTGFASMRAGDKIMMLWFVLGALYCAWAIFVAMTPALPDAAMLVGAQMMNFFELHGYGTLDTHNDPTGAYWLALIARAGLVGVVFWLVRSYALSLQNSRMIFLVCGGLFAFSLIGALLLSGLADGPLFLQGSWKGYGPGFTARLIGMGALEDLSYSSLFLRSAEIGASGVVFLYMPAALIGAALLNNCLQRGDKQVYALGGLGVLAVLLCVDLWLAASPVTLSVFISGWALISMLWQFSISPIEKTYRLRQL